MKVYVLGPGGMDPTKPNNNIVSEREIPSPPARPTPPRDQEPPRDEA